MTSLSYASNHHLHQCSFARALVVPCFVLDLLDQICFFCLVFVLLHCFCEIEPVVPIVRKSKTSLDEFLLIEALEGI